MNNDTLSSKKAAGKLYQPLAIAALMASSLFQPFVLPVLGAAGDQISNTATATYQDDDGNTFDTESNTVNVTVAEIAGITVEGDNVIDQNGGSFEAGDTLDFRFEVTNVGNDTTDVRIPGLTEIGTENFNPTQIEIFDDAGNSLIAYASPTGVLLVDNLNQPPLGAGESIIVVITGTVPDSGLNPGDDISVTLGDTDPNDNSPATQNQPADASTGNVMTDDLDDGENPNEATGTPSNGEREASAMLSVDFATEQRPLALITVEKMASNVDPGATGAANDDVITYDLSLTVEDSSPNGSFIPEDLAGTPIMLDGASTSAVLVSDAIPESTVFNGNTSAPNANWTVVYSVDDPATTSPVIATGATAAEWTTAPPAVLSTVTRIGFIYTSATPLPANGVAITPFQFDVLTNGLPATGGTIYNLAQAFGTTYDDPADVNDPVDQIIYDESGDDNPNNFNDDGTPPAEDGDDDGSTFDPNLDNGIANPTEDGTDDGSNDGMGPMGEDNMVPLTGEELSGDDNILNGPANSPGAVGPTDDDDDYTNGAIDVEDIGANPAMFTNTVSNPSTNDSQIDNVTLVPIDPVTAAANDDDDNVADPLKYGDSADIPNGTTVTITYDPTLDANGRSDNSGDEQSATYIWNGTTNMWDFDTSTGTPVANGPVNIGTLQPGEQISYLVDVNFPMDAPAEGDVIPVAIIAFPDTGALGYDTETVNNITLDNVHIGFMSVIKEARILRADGTVAQEWTQTPTMQAEPGSIIEYRITYENTSAPLVGSGNVILNAQDFTIVEDGDIFDRTNVGGDNNWHSDVSTPLTVHANGTSVSNGIVRYYQEFDETVPADDVEIGTVDPADGAEVEAYVNEVGTVAPGGRGTMIFRRTVQ